MKYLSIVLFILISLGNAKLCKAQTGLLGRNIVVKTNPLSYPLDKGIDAEVEVAAFRRVTIGLHYFSSQRELNWGQAANATVDAQHFGLKYRVYMPSAVLAPKGWYVSFNVYGGKINAVGEYNINEYGYGDEELEPFELSNTVITLENSIGKQVFLTKRIVLDCYLGLSHTTIPASKTHGAQLDQVGKTYSSKLALVNFNTAFGDNIYEDEPYLEGSSEDTSAIYGGFRLGFMF